METLGKIRIIIFMVGKMKHKRSIGEIKPLLKDIKEALNKIYGDRLLEMILYGSFARDDATDDSDIDIAVLLKGDVDKFREIERMNNVIYQIVLEYGELVAFYPLSKDEFSDYEWPLHYHIQMEGIKV